MNKCLTCGKNCEKEYCFKHKPRTALKSRNTIPSKEEIENNIKEIYTRNLFFASIWAKRPHKSEVSGEYLGKEPLTVFFHHILEKENYKQAEFDEENIILLTWQEHDQVEIDMYRYEEINKRREKLKIKYGLD